MNRSVEFFIRKGKVTKQAFPLNQSQLPVFGNILMHNVLDDSNSGQLVFTHFQHSFEDPASQPKVGQEVFFFLIPMEYVVPELQMPATIDNPFLAVNVSALLPYMASKKGHAKRHPCNTVLTIEPDKTLSWIQYGINDYGEFSIFHTATRQKPWTKLILKDPPTRFPGTTQSKYRIRSPKLKSSKNRLHELPYFEFGKKDPVWEWRFSK